MKINFVIPCLLGLESLIANEMKDLGQEAKYACIVSAILIVAIPFIQNQIDKIDELINNLVSTAYSMLPDKIVAFQTGGKYDNTSATYLKVRGKPFPTTIRFQKY